MRTLVRRRPGFAIAGLAALGLVLVSCSSDSSPKSTTSSTAPTTAVAAASTTTVTAAAGATTSAAPTSLAPGQTAPTTVAGATTTAAARVVSNPSSNVHLGDSGSGVKQIQTALVAHGYKVATDGQFGPQTAQAVKDFQKNNGLTQDGVVGPKTWAKLQAASSTTTTTGKSSSSTTSKSTTTTTTH
jgi:peptidoglycan hydrolase-like protein with peptidoglycan-binding domain